MHVAELIREESDVVLKLSTLEKVEGVHGDIRVPIADVTSVRVVDDIIQAVHGLKLPGSRLPGVFAMGTFVAKSETMFAMIHHHTKRGLRIELCNQPYDVLLIGLDSPEDVARTLGFPTPMNP